jgi:hypothetical protein
MLISHRHEFVFTKTGKTAGTSVEAYFEPYCMPEGEWSPRHLREMYESDVGVIGYRGYHPEGKRWYNHMPAYEIRSLLGAERWDRYFKFCTIRNPWDKTISAFESNGRDHRLPHGPEGEALRARYPDHDAEQLRFLHWLQTCGVPINRAAYVLDGDLCVDHTIRFERLHADLERTCALLEIPWEPEHLPTYKTGVRRPEYTVQRLYRAPARDLVAEIYSYEIERFGYRLPE